MQTPEPYSFFSLEAYDEASGFPVHEVYLERFARDEFPLHLANILKSLPGNESEDIDPALLSSLPQLIAELANWGSLPLRVCHNASRLPYRIHTGREFDLMTKGLKPFAFFSHPTEEHLDFLSRYFDPLVKTHGWAFEKEVCGTIKKNEEIFRYMYALPGEAWRITLFRLIHSRMKWSDALERIEGFLLGYTPEQGDLWTEYRKRRGQRWGLQRVYKFVTPEEEKFLEATGQRIFMPLAEDAPPIVLYYPQVEDNYEVALATLQPLKLARLYVSLAKLLEFSRGVSTIAGIDFGVYQIPKSEFVRLNRSISGTIEVIESPSSSQPTAQTRTS